MDGPMQTDVVTASSSLDSALEALRTRGLGLRRASEAPPPGHVTEALPTGQPELDAALRTDGWPRGALALLDATPGGGATTLALGSLAAVQARGGIVAWLDTPGVFDPATAVRLGVRLEWLLVVRPASGAEAVELAAWLARDRLLDAMALDPGDGMVPRGAWDRLATLLPRTETVTLTLGSGARGAESAAAIRVALRRRAWLAAGRDLVGQRVAATVERHRWALAGATAELDLWFAEGRRTDAWLRAAAEPAPMEVLPERRRHLVALSA
jgi:RecA/RadA recombinase